MHCRHLRQHTVAVLATCDCTLLGIPGPVQPLGNLPICFQCELVIFAATSIVPARNLAIQLMQAVRYPTSAAKARLAGRWIVLPWIVNRTPWHTQRRAHTTGMPMSAALAWGTRCTSSGS